jgi:hypothetical protein
MALNLDGIRNSIAAAVKNFWQVREDKGVRAGKTLDGFVSVISQVVHNNGMPNASIITGSQAAIPGYFRPSKNWDILIMNQGVLVAIIELKSIADSFGNNSNNRSEEAIGSGIDAKEALSENAFEGLTRLFSGYILLVEDCSGTNRNVNILMKQFRAMSEFMADPSSRDTIYQRGPDGLYSTVAGVSYMKRFDILCTRLMQKSLYTSAAVITTSREAISDGAFSYVSQDTSIMAFMSSLASHIANIATIQESNSN